MRLHVASDLHFEGNVKRDDFGISHVLDADALVLAGDIGRGTGAVSHFADWPIPVVYVHGNLEARAGHMIDLVRSIDKEVRGTSVTHLEHAALVIGQVRFLGCCLWTDFELYGAPEAAKREARRSMPEYERLRGGDGRAFSPEYSAKLHRRARAWLTMELAKPFAGKTVVVTHHAPSPLSIPPQFARSSLSPAFASDLTPLMEHVDLWIHGHTHWSCDYTVGRCRVLCNARGYRNSSRHDTNAVYDNPAFAPKLVISV